MFKEGAFYRVKRFHSQDGQVLNPGELLQLQSITETCDPDNRIYRYAMLFWNVDGKGKDYIWDKTQPPDEETGIDLLEPIHPLEKLT
jgi:hypothetical protein